MADKTLEQMLEHLVNNEQEKAEELFHEYVVAKSREIYETLIESEVEDEEEVDEATEEDEETVEEATEESDEEEVSEELSDNDFLEADDDDMDDMMGGDETDDLAGELDEPADEMDMDDEGDDEIFQDLEAIIDELQSKFDELKGEDDMEMDDEGDMEMDDDGDMEMDDEEMKDDFDVELATVREYVEKIGAPNNADTADNKKSIVDNMKNDMGGTTANILSDKTDEKGRTADKPKEENAGNVNVPGGKASKSMSKESGGASDSESGADNTDSLFRGKRS